ncbi:MAG: hypothetical protein KBF73_01975 [Flavobacteriales bacterium]|nr:hypothetical protein [Flavobacteriales bacterium]
MDTKLTLKLDKSVIEDAKKYAASHQQSLSRIIESYLKVLTAKEPQKGKEEIEITPLVKSLSGVIKLPTDFDERKAYRDHLEEKYK